MGLYIGVMKKSIMKKSVVPITLPKNPMSDLDVRLFEDSGFSAPDVFLH